MWLDAASSFDYLEAMPQNEVTKKPHFIPQFYLKRWTGKDGRLAEYRKQYKGKVSARMKFPKATGYVKPEAVLQGLSPSIASHVEERYFKPVDFRASQALELIERGSTHISEAERVAWTQFVLSLVHRQPDRIDKMREMLVSLTLNVTKADQRRWSRKRREGDPKRLADAIRKDMKANKDQLEQRIAGLMTSAINSTRVGTHFVNMRWGALILPPSALTLLTSDMPVHWFGPLVSEGCHILVPIGPKRIFFAVNNLETEVFLRAQPAAKIVEFLNDQTTRRAIDYVYSISEGQLDYVQGRMGVSPQKNSGDAAYEQPTPKRLKMLRRAARDGKPLA